MNSDQIKNILQNYNYHLSDYLDFNTTNKVECIKFFPKSKGIYIIRLKKNKHKLNQTCRLKDESDTLYVGKSSEKSNGLKGRIQGYFNPGPTQTTNQRINRFLDKYNMEIAYSEINDGREFLIEKELLNLYENDHDELPPLNRNK